MMGNIEFGLFNRIFTEIFKKSLLRVSLVGLSILFTSCATASIPPKPFNLRAELSSPEVPPGGVVRLTVHLQETRGELKGEFEGISVPFFPASDLNDGVYEAILGVPYERKSGPGVVRLDLSEEGQQSHLEVPIQIQEGNYPSESLHVDKSRVNPTGKKTLARIIREQKEVQEIYGKVTLKKFWKGPFEFPLKSQITSPFGIKRIYNGRLRNYHPGLDLRAPLNTPILAPAGGKVVLAKSLFYTGNTVMLDHGYGIITLYAHMNRLKVHLGEIVKPQQILGLSGKTGRVNGPHLHWQAVVHRVKVNPTGLSEVIR